MLTFAYIAAGTVGSWLCRRCSYLAEPGAEQLSRLLLPLLGPASPRFPRFPGPCYVTIARLPQHEPVIQHVASHPAAVWLVGPFFAAVTGVAFKEGLCYGKAEAAGLFFITPLLLLGHLTGWIPEDGQTVRSCRYSWLMAGCDLRKRGSHPMPPRPRRM